MPGAQKEALCTVTVVESDEVKGIMDECHAWHLYQSLRLRTQWNETISIRAWKNRQGVAGKQKEA